MKRPAELDDMDRNATFRRHRDLWERFGQRGTPSDPFDVWAALGAAYDERDRAERTLRWYLIACAVVAWGTVAWLAWR